jgi:hypothetical protein
MFDRVDEQVNDLPVDIGQEDEQDEDDEQLSALPAAQRLSI